MLAVLFSCIEPYNPPAITELVDLLVVDGFINTSDSSATVRLTKASALSEEGGAIPEINASVFIEDEIGNSFDLTEKEEGNYFISKGLFASSRKYRVVIATRSNKNYFSDFIDLKTTPPIDSINWRPSFQDRGIDIFVNTHDDEDKTRYYQWTFDETWEYTAKYPSAFRVSNGVVLPLEESIYRCWISKPSTEIHIASNNQLTEDIIKDFRLVFIPIPSQKVMQKYSILVKQRALTKEAYDFYTQLKKSTESLGGLFDPMPSQVLGNIHAENPDEPVLGYFGGGEVREKRKFIQFSDLPIDLREYLLIGCPIDSIPLARISVQSDVVLINSYGSPGIIGYTTSPYKNCMDCRDDGGQLVRPDFW